MKRKFNSSQRGQSLIEYALLLVLVALVAIPLVFLFGGGIRGVFQQLFSDEPASTQVVLTEVPTSLVPTEALTETPIQFTKINSIAQDFMTRIMIYYNTNGEWPSDKSSKAYSDIGLKNSDWNQAVEGVYWEPRGSTVNLTNKKKDDIQLYVNDLNGNPLKVYDGWSIVCVATSGSCYYHTVAPGNEVDVNSLVAVEDLKK